MLNFYCLKRILIRNFDVTTCVHFFSYLSFLVQFLIDIQDNIADYQVEPVQLMSKMLHEKIRSVFDYRCIITGAEHQFYVISLGVSSY